MWLCPSDHREGVHGLACPGSLGPMVKKARVDALALGEPFWQRCHVATLYPREKGSLGTGFLGSREEKGTDVST